MSRLYIFTLCILLALPAVAQRTQQRIAVGDDFYNKEQFHEAIKVYERILRRESNPVIRQELSFKMGESYRRLLNYEEAKKWYTIALNLGFEDPIIFLYLGEMTLGLEEFENSIFYSQLFLESYPGHELGTKLLQSAQFAKDNYTTETIFEVSNERGLNNRGQQWGVNMLENVVVVFQDQARVDAQFDIDIRLRYNNIFYWALVSRTLKDRVIFSSTLPMDGSSTGGYSNIYQATFNRRKGDWDMPRLLGGGINSNYYDGFLSYDAVNEIGYFMNSGGQTGNRATADIYTVKYNKNNDFWGSPEMFVFNSDEFNIGYPSINEDGTVLYFASDMPGGFGRYDIYKMIKDEEGNWGDPINLGPVINTEFNESYPFIAGNVLYFSSYGHPGFGGFDVFYSIIDEDGNYGTPINMGAPVNSSADDFGFVIDDNYTRGFFSSNRPGGEGEDDIYSFRVVPKTFMVQGRVINQITGEPVGGLQLFFYDDNNNFFDAITDAMGFYTLPDLSTNVNYYISAYPDGFHELADTLAVRDQLLSSRFTVISDYERNFALIPLDHVAPEPEPVDTKEEPVMVTPDPLLADDFPALDKTPKDEVPATRAEDTIEDQLRRRGTEQAPVFTLSSDGFPTIYFDFGKANLTPTAIAQLDTMIRFMRANPEKGVIVHAHTDEISGYLFNFYLSQQRAQSILVHLRRNGIDPSRIYPKGHGKMQLVVRNATGDAQHRLNRRATFESIPMNELQAYLEDASRHSFRYLNSIEKEAHFAQGVEFMVQFMASHVPINPQFYRKIMENIPDVDIIYYYDTDRYHRYLVGSFKDFDTAFAMQRRLRELGYEIYVVAFHNGDRIPVSRARRLVGEL